MKTTQSLGSISLKSTFDCIQSSEMKSIHYLNFFDSSNMITKEEFDSLMDQKKIIFSSLDTLRGGDDVHSISIQARDLFRIALRIFEKSEVLLIFDYYINQAFNQIKKQAQGTKCFETFSIWVQSDKIIFEGQEELGRMSHLVGLMYLLGGEDSIKEIVKVLNNNEDMGGGCPQGMFNRFVICILSPQIDFLLSQIENSLISTSKKI